MRNRAISGFNEASTAASRHRAEPSRVVIVIDDRIATADILKLWKRVRILLRAGRDAHVIICDVGALRDPDAVTVDALARLQLTVRRGGREVRILDARAELHELLALMGLLDVLPPCGGLPLEPIREVEEREEAGGVEEEADAGDAPR